MPLQIKQLQLGAGLPKIAVPLTGRALPQLTAQLDAALNKQPDLIEWRVDYLQDLSDDTLIKTGQSLHRRCQQIPLIATIRTKQEGGQFVGDDQYYQRLLQLLIANHCADIFDREVKRQVDLQQNAKKAPLIFSAHYFHNTPGTDGLKKLLGQMAQQGADILKLATMPHNSADVLRLLAVSNWAKEHFEQPIVTMAMGPLGTITRIAGAIFGSAITFATVQQSSAPGQLSIEQTRQGIQLLQKQENR
ncbi:type I 3-dehydroquinate dehydratase [Limosilactobacillus difficilis]|uniref:type I 3-dehydroquinate dehydratase n=1 Tax=Limosilactobacillus difficilis TaxID=2991838 RepID=UPI0024BA5B7F|nr:type I 3-dehydroquinate dehydratase [Limosilactobacillus difficilis]